MKSLFSALGCCFLLVLCSSSVWAQSEVDSVTATTDEVVPADTLTRAPKSREGINWQKWKPLGLRIGTDLAGPTQQFIDGSTLRYEIAGDIQIKKYLAVLELGQTSAVFRNEELSRNPFEYRMSGSYVKVGADINLLKPDPKFHGIFLGARYARARFSDEFSFDYLDTENTGYGNQTYALSQSGVNAQWFELVGSLKVNVWKNIFFGYSARFQFGYRLPGFENSYFPYAIPGYGLASRNSWQFNYYIQYRIPLSKSGKVAD